MTTFTTEQRKTLTEKKMAMPDGSYPIRNRSDLRNAISSYGRAKNKPAVKAWIIRRAKELNCEDLIPESWGDNVRHLVDGTSYLIHYGVLGMKWGVRKKRKTSLSSRSSKSSSKISKKKNSLKSKINAKLTPERKQKLKQIAKTSAVIGGKLAIGAFLGYGGVMAVSEIQRNLNLDDSSSGVSAINGKISKRVNAIVGDAKHKKVAEILKPYYSTKKHDEVMKSFYEGLSNSASGKNKQHYQDMIDKYQKYIDNTDWFMEQVKKLNL